MATSANGYPVLFENRTTGPLPRLRKWVVPGTQRHLYLRDGSTGFLLIHFALWLHERVEPLDDGVWDDWGWAVRPVRGQSNGYSNHASGTAEDLNATRHPLAQRGTFGKVATYAKIRARLAYYRGALEWGGDYHSRLDEMHFEIAASIGACEARARKLMDTPRGRRILEANPGAREAILS